MFSVKRHRRMPVRLIVPMIAIVAGTLAPGTALAASGNDNFADAVAIPGLPFQQTADTTGSTLEPGEPVGSCREIGGSVWYSFTATSTGSVTARASTGAILPVLTA